MNVHEYQAKQLFRDFGIPVPNGKMCTREDSVPEAGERAAACVSSARWRRRRRPRKISST